MTSHIFFIFCYALSFPQLDIYVRPEKHGEYPDIYKLEMVTPAPKVYPNQTTNQLRKISGTLYTDGLKDSAIPAKYCYYLQCKYINSLYFKCKQTNSEHKYVHNLLQNALMNFRLISPISYSQL